MRTLLITGLLALAGLAAAPAYPQDPQVTGDRDGSSQRVEESDEAYRRRMELEDARQRQPTYTDPGGGYQREAEKIDKLPPESRENIRDQLVDIIMENPDWEPSDALQEYPYEPTAAAQADPSLMQQEQEAWDEQVEKYHAREAEAFGAYRGPVAGPGNPDGAEGGQQGQSGEQGQGGSGQQGGAGGQQGGQAGSQGQAGTYQPYQPAEDSAEDAVSTAGVSESALDFLKAQRAPAPGTSSAQAAESAGQAQQQSAANAEQAAQSASQSQSQSGSDEAVDEADMRGIIAIEDLDKLEGAGGVPVTPPPREEEDKEGGGG